ncbi:type I restriction endonuclease subunit R [Bradyrhizobium diazoefficiens]|uniref:type I restriction endonuclease subunit R n=1 Tax=Bradyrhizobium diazoefficiens TaxID=1355477 RepID=UPI000D7267E2|nr:type I restriction endonuclease [Bradyrhizobium diazoefficiens]AWO92414.1 type I restriction endonuclease subunit R [Bradyrhizobium diazoefficiens]
MINPSKHIEARFEDAIEIGLLARGYEKGNPSNYDADRGLFPEDVVAHVKTSQSKKWQSLAELQGDAAEATLIDALVKELASKGTLHVLRHGFKCFGKTYQMAAFKPASGMNPEAVIAYEQNILRITRQVPFNPATNETVDVVLSLNGLPVVTAELKNPMSGQNVENAKHQYANDRDPRTPLFRFKERALVHFAVDTDLAFMTTKLDGRSTSWLPFNRGYLNGAGNPPGEAGNYRTAYLWEDVLTRDSLMDILARYIHLQIEERQVRTPSGIRLVRKETMIFPRYHQLTAVRKLVADAQLKGSGHNYLVQHSAGSGKSNSIAWVAHHLAGLHDSSDDKVFDTVVVVTDRLVLDQQLQDTIYQFEHKKGVVEKIDENTQQLAKALAERVPIIISTVQKFPFISQAINTLAKKGDTVAIDTAGRRFAIIVDEAHSSAAGETAQELRRILNKDGIEAAVAAQILDEEDDSGLSAEARENMLREMAKRPRQPNMSYFAFTATPKFKTKVLFDEPGENGKSPFHLYSMRQAIQEGFIMDVLANYTTYKAYFGLVKAVAEDPAVPEREAARALARFLAFHPHNLRQKVEVIVEHFRTFTKHKIGGRAKAMVVTGSRLHAVRYKQEMDKYIREKGYIDVKTLVAFSGEVIDPDIADKKYTEVSMNGGIRESELPEKFATEEYQVLIVAEKYQTGFDQPLLHTMYVDKRLDGVQAVQTLSRLNRRAPGKDETFVLDFVNEREDILKAFKPYYGDTDIGEIPDVHQLYAIQHELEATPVIRKEEITTFCEIWFRNRREPTAGEHKQLNGILDLAVERFKAISEEDKDEFKSKLVSFRNLYAFLAQVIPYKDSDLEKLYTYARFLLLKLPRRSSGLGYEIEDEVALRFYRLQKISEGSIDLAQGEAEPLKGPTQVGTRRADDQEVPLSQLVDKLNDRFGTDFKQADQLFFDQVAEAAIENETLKTAASVNTLDNFRHVFDRMLEGLFIDRMEGNEEIFDRIMNDAQFRHLASAHLVREVYERLRTGKNNAEG